MVRKHATITPFLWLRGVGRLGSFEGPVPRVPRSMQLVGGSFWGMSRSKRHYGPLMVAIVATVQKVWSQHLRPLPPFYGCYVLAFGGCLKAMFPGGLGQFSLLGAVLGDASVETSYSPFYGRTVCDHGRG